MPDQKVKSEDNKSPDKEKNRTSDKKKNGNKQRFKNRKKKPYEKSRDKRTKTTNFKGSIVGMNGHVFQMFAEGASTVQFTRTCEQLEGYVLRNYKYGTDLQSVARNMEQCVINVPEDPIAEKDDQGKDKPISESIKYIWHSELKDHVTRVRMLRENSASLFSVIWSQCSKPMQSKVKTADTFDVIEKNSDFLGLLMEIKCIAYKFETQGYIYSSLHEAKKAFFKVYQFRHETDSEYLTRFKAIVAVIKHYKGNIGDDLILVQTEIIRSGMTLDEHKHISGDSTYDMHIKYARARALALAFIEGADRSRFAQLHIDMINNFNRGQDIYPTSLTQAYNMIVNHVEPIKARSSVKAPPANNRDSESESEDDIAFVQKGAEHVTCFDCGKKGHFKNSVDCEKHKNNNSNSGNQMLITSGIESESEESDTLSWCMVNVGFNMTNKSRKSSCHSKQLTRVQKEIKKQGNICKYWILLDSESTIDIIRDENLLRNIRRVEEGQEMRCFTNGGHQDSVLIGDLPGYDTVWFNPESIANILSLARVSRSRRVTMDTGIENCFNVYTRDRTVRKFLKSNRGLYYHDIRWGNSSTVLANTVSENKVLFTPRMINRADKARRLYGMIGRPTEREYVSILSSNELKNTSVTVKDAKTALKIYGPEPASLMSNITRRSTTHVNTDIMPLPREILQVYRNVTLCADILFIGQIICFGTISRKLLFTSTQPIKNRKKVETILPHIKVIRNIYKTRGFKVTHLVTDT